MADLKKLYDDVIMDHIKQARNFREMANASAKAEGVNVLCGDNLTVYVRVEDDILREAAFQCECCGISMASASIMTELVAGKSVAEAKHIAADLLESFSEEHPEHDAHYGKAAVLGIVREFPSRRNCASLAWVTLNAALDGKTQAVLGG
ncbi:MAG: SUF system NifU family Fe-S cluster assembly protein [Burkholderiales bacterium]